MCLREGSGGAGPGELQGMGSPVFWPGKGKPSGGEQQLVSRTFYPCPPQLPEGSPHAPYSLPDITNCLVTFPIL